MLVPVPLTITLSGNLVSVHVPEEGNPFSMTLPVADVQVRSVTVPIEGAEGIAFTAKV